MLCSFIKRETLSCVQARLCVPVLVTRSSTSQLPWRSAACTVCCLELLEPEVLRAITVSIIMVILPKGNKRLHGWTPLLSCVLNLGIKPRGPLHCTPHDKTQSVFSICLQTSFSLPSDWRQMDLPGSRQRNQIRNKRSIQGERLDSRASEKWTTIWQAVKKLENLMYVYCEWKSSGAQVSWTGWWGGRGWQGKGEWKSTWRWGEPLSRSETNLARGGHRSP